MAGQLEEVGDELRSHAFSDGRYWIHVASPNAGSGRGDDHTNAALDRRSARDDYRQLLLATSRNSL